DWEWDHLHSRLDDSAGRIVAEPGGAFLLLHLTDAIQVGQILPNGTLRLPDLGGHPIRSVAFSAKEAPIANVMQASGGLRLLEWLEDKGPRLWDEAAAPRFRLTLRYVCDLSPDGSRFAMPGPTGKAGEVGLLLYETSLGRPPLIGVAHKKEIWAV